MKARLFRLFLLLNLAWIPLSNIMGQAAEGGQETKIAEMLEEADSLLRKDPDQSLRVLNLALSMAQEGDFPNLEGETEFRLSRAYMMKGYYNTALKSAFNALRYYEYMGDSSGMGKSKHRLAIIYLETDNNELSLRYDKEALQLLDPQKDTMALAWTYVGLGNYMGRLKDQDSSLYYYTKALEMAQMARDERSESAILNNIALVYKEKKDYAKALEHFEKCISISSRLNDFNSTAFTLDNMGAMFLIMGEVDKALQYSEKAYEMAIEHQSASGLVNMHSNLAQAYQAKGNYAKAFKHQKAYTELIKEYFNEKSSTAMADMEGKYQNEKKEAEIALLNKDNELKAWKIDRQNTVQNLLSGSVALLLILIIFVIFAYRDKQKTNKLLHAQQEEIKRINAGLEEMVKERTAALENANSELNELLYRTSHDLRTPITKIMGLVGLAKSEAMPPGQVLEYLDATMEMLNQQNLSICEIGIIRHHSPKPSRVDLRESLEEVLAKLQESSPDQTPQVQLEIPAGLQCTADPYLLKIATREVLANALSFGQNGGSPIELTASQDEKQILLSVRDKGPGIPAEIRNNLFDLFVKGTHSPGHFGLGLYKAKLAVERLGGQIQNPTTPAPGSTFTLQIPV